MHNGSKNCFYESHKVDDLIRSTKEVIEEMGQIAQEIKGMTQEMATMNKQNHNVMRILLAVVCVIALGKAALDIKDLFISKAAAVEAPKN